MAHIIVLSELVRVAPDAFESKSDVLVPFLVTKVLMAPPETVNLHLHFYDAITMKLIIDHPRCPLMMKTTYSGETRMRYPS